MNETTLQYEITLENGDKRIITEKDIRKGTRVFYTETGPGFGMEAVVEIKVLPHPRILNPPKDA